MGAPLTPATPMRTPTRRRSPSKRLYNIVRSELWFSDGNVVIVASSVAFKVHRGQLRRHSEVFDDLFSLPQPKDQDLYDGCPWVEVYDCPSDVLYFLKALYDGLYFKTPGANDFPAVAAVLRLSNKYLVEHLRQRCMARLELDWPSTLAGWDQREQAATDASGHYAPRASCPHPILVIDLALDLGLSFLLPSALYDLSRYGPSKIMAGTAAPTTFFSLRICHAQARFALSRPSRRSPAPDCLYLEEDVPSRMCRESFYFIMLNVLRSVGGIACGRDADPLFTLVQAMDMLSRTDFSDGHRQCGLKLCHPCKVDFANSATRAREERWPKKRDMVDTH
ncbi:BTB domain-containing protein [Mycena sanguinolenta]|uniref:BTB domain-containing protein n=1 Tax=Mycena sanguinolenta TaxID=230812 RepID=A0A8H6YIJ4_9AGAR|nr:BTB domain-containing protein [Mycena sanguinolenta]